MLDLACGHGRLVRELARRGAEVVGIDISAALLDKARAREQAEPLGITYLHSDAASPDALIGEIFDGVACHFGLSDIDDLEGAVATVARVLQPGGFFCFSILYPCFPAWEAKGANPSWAPGCGYFEEGWWLADGPSGGLRPRVGSSHRMLSTYMNTLTANRLSIEEASEPYPTPDWIEVSPGVGPVPVYLVVRCRKR
jgi:SAM-dependent methyltransferase